MILENQIVITGVFNYTRSAQAHNSENLIIMHNLEIAALYAYNWKRGLDPSNTLEEYQDYKNLNLNKRKAKNYHHRHIHEVRWLY